MLVPLALVLSSALLGPLCGFVLNSLRLRFTRWLSRPDRAYLWLVRGMPYLSQMVIVYFGLPVLGLTLSAVQATVVSLAFYSAAYFAEIFRAGWASIPPGQLDAARAFGIGRAAAFRTIELPQALVFSIPLLANQTILVIKESAVASITPVPKLPMTASEVVSPPA